VFEEEKQKLIDNWVEDPWERKKQIKKLYETLCFESNAEVLQLKIIGMIGEKIQEYAMNVSAVNIGWLLEIMKRGKRKIDVSVFENGIMGN
jgi:hypothetical protein